MTIILTEFFFIILCFRFGVLSDTLDPNFYDCGKESTQNINLQSNLNNLFSTLNSTFYSSNTGFAEKTINPGTKTQFNGLIMCYLISNESSCFNCLNVSFASATILCPNSSSATFTYDYCFLRYSNENFISDLNLKQPPNFYHSQDFVKNSSTFNKTVSELLNSLIPEANKTSTLLYAFGNETDPGINQTVFGLVQCTRDLSKEDCGLCLQSTIGNLTSTVTEEQYKGLRVSSTSCYVRYELYPLFNLYLESPAPAPGPLSPYSPPPFYPDLRGTALAQPPQISNIAIGSSSQQLPKTIGVSVGAIAATLVLAACGIWLWRRRSIASTSKNDEEESNAPLDDWSYSSLICSSECQVFELDTLRLATNNFSDENKLGEGGFGSVYKGSLIHGQEVAVKRLSGSSRQGLAELKNEVDLLAKLKHKNLVQLVGCCIEQKEKLLCYEFLAKGSLDNFLFANEAIRREELNWETRYGIIHGISCGLQYLHEEFPFKIIHRDLKASNILLDIDMSPKISDFGVARLFDEDQTHKDTSIVAGTFGYMAPEYVLHGSISAKSDVYSFGVLLLEIVTGRKISSFTNAVRACNLISYVRQHVAEGKIDQLKDPVLDNANSEEFTKCIHIGLLCVHDDPTKRPSMAAIGVMLDGTYTTSIPALLPSPHISSMPSPLISTSDQESTS